MQTLISAFQDRSAARRAVERLVQAGFEREDLHMQEPGSAGGPEAGTDRAATGARGTSPADDTRTERELGERTMATAEREVAADRTTLEAMGHFLVSLFGADRGEGHARRYGKALDRGHTLVFVDADSDEHAEAAAMILHEQGAVEVDDHDEGRTPRTGVHLYRRDAQPALRDLALQRQVREESMLAERGPVSRERLDQREGAQERAIASGRDSVPTDRPD